MCSPYNRAKAHCKSVDDGGDGKNNNNNIRLLNH